LGVRILVYGRAGRFRGFGFFLSGWLGAGVSAFFTDGRAVAAGVSFFFSAAGGHTSASIFLTTEGWWQVAALLSYLRRLVAAGVSPFFTRPGWWKMAVCFLSSAGLVAAGVTFLPSDSADLMHAMERRISHFRLRIVSNWPVAI
jgi:hypothetical protein